jgi:glutathione S-transferase
LIGVTADSALPVLYSFRRCPYAIRARLALRAAGIRCSLREVLLRNKPPELLACSPKATVPVLVLDDGEVIDESLEIMYWALSKNDPGGWLAVDMQIATRLIDENDDEFKSSIDRYKYPDRYPDAARETHRASGEVFLARLENRLASASFLCGDQLSLVDVALLPFVRQFAYVDIGWFQGSRYLAVNAWLQRFLESARFAAVMQKYPAWQSDSRESPDQTPVF